MTDANEALARAVGHACRREHPTESALLAAIVKEALTAQGFAVVPVEPTKEMAREGAAKHRDFLSESAEYPRTRAVYKAMIKAAQDKADD